MVIKIPSSMMMSPWMGSDFTNDDLVRSSDLVRDYKVRLLHIATRKGSKQAAVLLRPKPNAPVVWGKLILWVRTKDLQPMSQEYYNERGKLMRVMTFSHHKKMGGRLFPTVMRMKDLSKPGNLTEIKYLSIAFNQRISRRTFTLRNLKKKNW